MIYIIYGKMGCGKTLLATYLAIKLSEQTHSPIIANYHIFHPACVYRQIPLPKNKNEQIIVLDDIYAYPTWFQNFILRVIVLLSRKRKMNIIITTQRLAVLLHKTIRLLACIINPIRINIPDNTTGDIKIRTIEMIESAVRVIPIRFQNYVIPRDILSRYDTNEIILGITERQLIDFVNKVDIDNDMRAIYLSAMNIHRKTKGRVINQLSLDSSF